MRALLVIAFCVSAPLLLRVVYFAPGQSFFEPGSRSELTGEVDLDNPFPGVSEFGTQTLFKTRLADGSRVNGRYSRTGRDSEWTRHSPEGVLLVRANYLDGIEHGEWTSFYRATGMVRESGSYKGGVEEGTWTMFYDNGELFESVEFDRGREHGRWTIHHRNGSRGDEMIWRQGEQVGVETDYAPDGRVVAEGRFEANLPRGTWTCYQSNGTVRSILAPAQRITPRQACGFGAGPDEVDDDY